uniref:Acyl-coenzyme A binding domain containing n=1 Tax=Rhizophora mucronata TaxID=61149 RepID=A0A2P2JCF1_RHIMU
MSIYFCIASSGGMAPSFCQACHLARAVILRAEGGGALQGPSVAILYKP